MPDPPPDKIKAQQRNLLVRKVVAAVAMLQSGCELWSLVAQVHKKNVIVAWQGKTMLYCFYTKVDVACSGIIHSACVH